MNTIKGVPNTFFFTKTIHWKLLLFLLLFLDVKLSVKVAAVLFIYISQPNFRFGFRWNASRLPLFYLLVIVIALLNTIIFTQFLRPNYTAALLVGISFWCLCILAIHQLKLIVETTDAKTIYNTLIVFFLLNAFVSVAEYISIVIETGAVNPYRYQGNFQKYFISTGDYVKGVSFDTSTTNAIINSFGIIFFLWKRNWLLLLICACILLLTGSNLVNLVLFSTLAFLLVFKTDKEQKSMIVICCALLVVFMTKVSPQNNRYITEVYENIFKLQPERAKNVKPINVRETADDLLSSEQRKEKIALLYLDSLNKIIIERQRNSLLASAGLINNLYLEKPSIPEPSIHSAPFQNRDDTNAVRKELLDFITAKKEFIDEQNYNTTLPGKAIGFLQTARYISQHPAYVFTGSGLGNFSSKIAFKATSLKFAGGYPERLTYINPDFFTNHLNLYLHFFSKRSNLHSITNSPNAVYDQLIGEYGITGFAAFFVFYIGYFLKNYKKLSYGIPLLFLLLSFFFIDYWFEQLSIVVVFELLLLLNLKEKEAP